MAVNQNVFLIITPEPGRYKEIGQRLLALAEDPSLVQWVTWPTAGYAVPPELFHKFEQATAQLEQVAETPVEEPKKRGPGRPRRQPVEATDKGPEE